MSETTERYETVAGGFDRRVAACWRSARTDLLAAHADPVRAKTTVSGMFGEQTFESLVGRLPCADTLVHTWDLARATGQDEQLDAGRSPPPTPSSGPSTTRSDDPGSLPPSWRCRATPTLRRPFSPSAAAPSEAARSPSGSGSGRPATASTSSGRSTHQAKPSGTSKAAAGWPAACHAGGTSRAGGQPGRAGDDPGWTHDTTGRAFGAVQTVSTAPFARAPERPFTWTSMGVREPGA